MFPEKERGAPQKCGAPPVSFRLFVLEQVTDLGEQELFFGGLGRFFGFRLGGLFELGLCGVHRLDHKEDDEGDQEEIDDRGQEGAETQHDGFLDDGLALHDSGLERDIERRQVDAADQAADERHDDIRDEAGADLAEGRSDDNADGHVHDVAAGDEGFEFIEELFHRSIPLLFSRF